MAVLPQKVKEILDEYDLGKEAVWDCHGTWVMYHAPLEQIAAKAGVTYDDPTVIEADTKNKTATIMMRGHLPSGASEVTFGEASPANCKNSYPWAMAEKRAKDRIVLKLVGLHGSVYSMDEADWQDKPPAPQAEPANESNPPSIDDIKASIDACATKKALMEFKRTLGAKVKQLDAKQIAELKQHSDAHEASLAA